MSSIKSQDAKTRLWNYYESSKLEDKLLMCSRKDRKTRAVHEVSFKTCNKKYARSTHAPMSMMGFSLVINNNILTYLLNTLLHM